MQQKYLLPLISRKNIASTDILRIPVSQIFHSGNVKYSLSPNDAIYVSLYDEPQAQGINIYTDGKELILSLGIQTGLEYLGSVLGRSAR